MRYLLDVNALIALGISRHQFHSRIRSWLSILATNQVPKFATCSITELGFVRVVSQVKIYDVSLDQAQMQLRLLKESITYDFKFLSDNNDLSHLPHWVTTPKQTTDGHLVELASGHGMILATFDENIPGSFLIP